ncbi:MAG TPA: hypothetical protein DCF33_05360 [Saprospirales bacterium]|nr:hypothetical protein [Saprospirales bacterium]
MQAENIFTWISEMQLKTAFRAWWMQNYQNDIVPSYRTIIRTEKRIDNGLSLTKPQQKAVRRAEEFHRHWHSTNSQAA